LHLLNLFDVTLVGRRDSPALEYQDRTFTFGEVDARSNRLAQLLAHRGLKAGDRVCVYLAIYLVMIDLYLTFAKLGALFVPINSLYRHREMAHSLGDGEQAAVVSFSDFASPVPIWRPGELSAEACALHNERPEISKSGAIDGDAPVGIIYTSGTTGTSKGAV